MIRCQSPNLPGDIGNPPRNGNALGFDCRQPVPRVGGRIARQLRRCPRLSKLIASIGTQCRCNPLGFGCLMHGLVGCCRLGARNVRRSGRIAPSGINQATFCRSDIIR